MRNVQYDLNIESASKLAYLYRPENRCSAPPPRQQAGVNDERAMTANFQYDLIIGISSRSTYLDCPGNRRSAPPPRQQAGVDVECAVAGDVQKRARQDVAVGRGHAEVRRNVPQLLQESFLRRI